MTFSEVLLNYGSQGTGDSVGEGCRDSSFPLLVENVVCQLSLEKPIK